MRSINTMFLLLATSGLLLFAHPSHGQTGTGSQREVRTWTSHVGSKIRAALVANDEVCLRKEDGTILSLRLDQLAAADRAYVLAVRGRNATAPEPQTDPFAPELWRKLEELCKEFVESRPTGEEVKPTIAVVEFTNLEGGTTNLGRFLSEEMITRLGSTGQYKVIERFLLNKVIAEHKLQFQGLIEQQSARELGRILGVNAILSGTLADLGSSVRINARVLSTETGEHLASGATTIAKEEQVRTLIGISGAAETIPRGVPATAAGLHSFRQDFRSVKSGALPPGWEGDTAVGVQKNGNRVWLEASERGTHSVKIPNLAISGSLDLEISARFEGYGSLLEMVLVGRGASESLSAKFEMTRGSVASLGPNPAKNIDLAAMTTHQFRLQRDGDIIRFLVNGQEVFAQRMAQYGDFEAIQLKLTGPASPRGDSMTWIYGVSLRPLSDK